MDSTLIGAFKVKDGLFIGDEFAAQDLEFVVANKVTRIINCAARQVPNHWEPIGIIYLSFAWLDTETQIILDASDKNFSVFFKFIEQGLETGESVLVHSVRGVSRCVCVVGSYLMKKYQWSLYKSLDFIGFRRPDLDLNPGFLTQLGSFEARLCRATKVPRTDQWDQVLDNGEELILTNTLLNARMGQPTDYHLPSSDTEKNQKITWQDQNEAKQKSRNQNDCGYVLIKSILKGSEKEEKKVPVFNLETLKEKAIYNKFSFGKAATANEITKFRSASLNKCDNNLVKEAISAARGLANLDTNKTRPLKPVQLKKKNREEPPAKVRPTTAPQKRAASPKVSDKKAQAVGSLKGSSFASLRKK